MQDILQQISALPPDKRALLAQNNPLSFSQQQLWLIAQMEPESPAYNLPYAVRLSGPLDPDILSLSLNDVVGRHEALRTVFPSFEAEPMQVVLPHLSLQVQFIDLSHLGGAEQEAELQRVASVEAYRPFDLARGPLLRASLIHLGPEEHAFVLVMHHIVGDAWSTRILLRELTASYEARVAGVRPPLPELTTQYADYAIWQRERLRGEELERQLSYWKERLAGAPSVIELPTDRPRMPVQSFRGRTHVFEFTPAETAGLGELSRRSQATLFMTVLGVFGVLLSRYARAEEVVVGAPVANRDLPEVEGLIGYFVNTLALRVDLAGDPTFAELLARVREATLADFAHQEVPFEKVVEAVKPERSLSHNPLFQVMLEVQNAGALDDGVAGLRLRPQGFDQRVSKFDLILSVAETPGGLTASLTYNTDLFDRATVVRIEGHLRSLIRQVAESPARRLSELSLLPPAERRQLLAEWNDTGRPYDLERPVHELFEEQARRTPDASALVFEGERLTYRELNERANRVARALAEGAGGGGDRFVPVLMDRSTELVVSLLGVLKAGAAFVTLGPDWPAERLKHALAELGGEPVLVSPATRALAEALGRRPLVVEAGRLEGPAPDPRVKVGTRQPVYAMYTSGSTGRPKAAAVHHGGLVNRLFWMNEFFGPEAAAVTLQTTHHVYDSAVWQFFWPLINGGRCVVPAPSMEHTAEYLTRLVAEHDVTTIDFVPSVLNSIVPQLLTDRELPEKLKSLRCVIIGGEEITPSTTHAFMGRFPHVSVTNLYGPTEATIGCIAYRLDGAEGNVIPIGRPIANAHAFILDRHMQPAPVGVPGELYLGGVCVGLGYLNDPGKTREAFVENPFAGAGGGRLYKTGDLARYLPDGNIQYLGRLDRQVKLRGFRIELGEIEAALEEHPGVLKCAAATHEPPSGQKRLVAYVVARATGTLEAAELRDFLRRKLPDYMLPSAFIQLGELPLTPSGKVDRKALPAPDDYAGTAGAYAAPRNATEQAVADIWAEVLGAERVGIRDDFFEAGGHSLLATQVVSRLRKTFRVELPLRSFFEKPTVEGIAAIIGQGLRDGEQPQAPPITPAPREEPLPLSFSQQRLWFLDQLVPGNAFYNIPYALRLSGGLDIAALEKAVGEIVRRHEILRTTFPSAEGQPVQRIHPPERPPLPVTELDVLTEEELTALAVAEAQRPFDLARLPLFRLSLLRLGPADHLLLLTMHHIISDGWSTGLLVQELAALYEAFAEGRPSPLPELPLQYADFAHWQRRWLTGEVLRGQLAYWKEHLAGVSPLELSVSRPRPDVQTFRGARHPLRLPRALNERLKSLGRDEGVTLFMTLLAAFQALLYRYSGQDNFAVGSPIAGRNRSETENLIGFFVNNLVLRADLAGDPSFRDLLARVREVCLAAYTHQDLPFEQLVEELRPTRDISRNPLFQVLFALHNTPRRHFELPGLTLTPLNLDIGTAKFDLWLSLSEEAEGVFGFLEYNTDLFDARAAALLAEHYQALLESVAEDPDQRLSRIPLLTPRQQQQLLESEGASADYPRDECIHQTFEAQARRTPAAVALTFGDETLTYRQLDERSNQLAAYLRRAGVGPEVRVGICVERSVEMVVGLLGILKAGGAYVPLDPEYPPERLAFMLEDAGASVLLTQRRLLKRIPPESVRAICLDSEREAIAELDTAPVESGVTAENLCYIIYTSGSTGRPKGAQLAHRSVVNFLYAMKERPGITPDDAVLAIASVSFDITGLEVYLPLMVGARVVLLSKATALDGALLKEQIERSGVTVVQATPATWRMLIEAGWEGDGKLKILCGAEALPADLAAALLRRGGSVWNLYGPTETTVWSTVERVSPEAGRISIGRPIPNMRVYLLDGELRPVPFGVIGELYIAGVGLGRGYYKRPGLTAETFLPNPFGPEEGGRIYRSGDLARYLPDGRVECLGRIDHQVKVRGFRIELDEIEAVLRAHDGVRDAAVIARESRPGEKQLIAYVELDPSRHEPGQGGAAAGDDWDADQIAQWSAVWRETYQQAPATPDPAFNINGWVSSFTGLPIPEEEMREWVQGTVSLVRSLRPRRVLDIGCGTGLVLFPVAPDCAVYCGTDIVPASIDYLRGHLGRLGPSSSHVTLLNRAADDFGGFEPRSFNTVILNSVVQYFPGIDYLLRVLAGAVEVVADGGKVLIGDVRSLPLLPALDASVELAHAHPGLHRTQLRQRLHKRLLEEEELVIDPAFFHALRHHLPRVVAASVRPKRGRHMNELTRFRYDVVLHVGRADSADGSGRAEAEVLDWQSARMTPDGLRRRLLDERPEALQLRRIPNGRVARELQLLKLLAGHEGPATAGDLRLALERFDPGEVADPQTFWSLGEELQYEVEFGWAGLAADGTFDVLLCRRGEDGAAPPPALLPEQAAPLKPWGQYANNPMQARMVRSLLPQLREALAAKLPDYMIPSAIVPLTALPLSPNGKVDRRALAALDWTASAERAAFVPARDWLELQLTHLWEEILGIKPVGVRDNFFKLGGHSLLAVRLMSQIRSRLGMELPLATLFQGGTVEHLAGVMRRQGEVASQTSLVEIQPAGARRPFFCVHPSGGNVLCYYELAHRLNPEQPFYGLQSPGLCGATAVPGTVEEMAASYSEELRRVQPEGPYQLGGWSMGGLVAFEMARQLRSAGQSVSRLILLDAYPPAAYDWSDEEDGLALARGFALNVGLPLDRLVAPSEGPSGITLDEALARTLEQAKAANLVPPDVEMETVRRLFEVFVNNLRAMRNYRPRPYDGSLVLVQAGETPEQWHRGTAQDWGALAEGGVTTYRSAGSHFTMVKSPHVRALAELVDSLLEGGATAGPKS